MATIVKFGKVTDQERIDLVSYIPALEQLISSLHKSEGVIEIVKFSNGIDNQIATIDDLTANLKPLLQQIKTDINA